MYRLRELERKDLLELNKWRNIPDLIEQLGAPFRFVNYEVDIKWYENYMLNRNNTVRCAIINENDSFIGIVSLTDINYINQSAEIHIMIGDIQNQGCGAGKFAICAMLKHAFNNLNLRRIELTVLEKNVRAQNLYEKVGFVKEGVLREAYYKNGDFRNVIVYSILKKDFHKEDFCSSDRRDVLL